MILTPSKAEKEPDYIYYSHANLSVPCRFIFSTRVSYIFSFSIF